MEFKKLAKWQADAKVNDVELARRVGVSHTTIGRAKRGETNLSMPKMLKLQKETGITPNDWADFLSRQEGAVQ